MKQSIYSMIKKVYTVFLNKTKSDIMRYGLQNGSNFLIYYSLNKNTRKIVFLIGKHLLKINF